MAKKMCLRPCYVCGRHPDVRCIGSSWYVKCECGQKILPSDYHAKNEVVAIWNYIQKNHATVVRELEAEYEWAADTFHGHNGLYELGQLKAFDNSIRIVKRGGRNWCGEFKERDE